MNLRKLSEKQLLALYSKIMEELRSRKVIRTSNNPIGDYAERLISEQLGLKLERSSNKGYDAVDDNGKRYQIKARRISARNPSRQLGVIKNLLRKEFDFVLAGIFNEEFELKELWKIPHRIIRIYAKYSKHQNGHILMARGPLLKDKRVVGLK